MGHAGGQARRTVYGRVEASAKDLLDLGFPDPPGFVSFHRISHVAAATVGYLHDVVGKPWGRLGIGGDATFYHVPDNMIDYYGTSPRSFHVFVRVSSAAARFDELITTEMLLSLGHPLMRDFHQCRSSRSPNSSALPCAVPPAPSLGRVREIAIAPQDPPTRIALSNRQDRRRRAHAPVRVAQVVRRDRPHRRRRLGAGRSTSPSDGVLLLKRDLLDQQIIDVHGRKVVRVNDVELDSTPVNSHVVLSVVAVDVGARGAIRRLTQGPRAVVHAARAARHGFRRASSRGSTSIFSRRTRRAASS